MLGVFAFVTTPISAQTIRYEQNGRQETYDLKSGKHSQLSRERTKIPWDEPGKISGVPGVLENRATDLPEKRKARATLTHRGRTPSPTTSVATKQRPQIAKPASRKPKHSTPEGAEEAVVAVSPTPPEPPTLNAEYGREAQAKMIAQFKARALAEEQRRFEVERNTDRHARVQLAPERQADRSPAIQTTAGPDYGIPSVTDAHPTRPRWKQSICRLLFFGGLRGC